MGDIIIKNENYKKEINLKYLFLYMDEVIYTSLNEGNMHFFATINFKENVKEIKEIKEKIKKLEENLKKVELISWYNIITEKNKNNNYHIHFILAIKSLLGYNENLNNNIKFFLMNNYEIDIKMDTCWNFIDIKKSWRYIYKDYVNIKTKKEENKKNNCYEKKLIKKNEKKINILKIEKNCKEWFTNIKRELNVEEFEDKKNFFIKGVKINEKNYNERQLFFLWEYFLLINNIIIYKEEIFIKIEKSMISYKKFNNINFLYENINEILFSLKKEFKFQFENFDELNFVSKFIKNKTEKITRFKDFSSRKINFNFNIMEFKDGIYSISHNKFVRKTKFEKNYNINLREFLNDKEILTTKFYDSSYENLKEPEFWLKNVEKVLGLKKRDKNIKDIFMNFIKEDNIESLLIYIAHIFHYSTNELNKKNTLYIWGPSNTGKTTLIINLFINYFGKENIGLISNNKNFEYQHIIDKNMLIFDEFDINKIDIDNFKKLISKELILGEKKGKEPEIIKGKPIIISSNYSLEEKLNYSENKEAIINRLKIINFKEIIKENEMDVEINKKIKEEEHKIIIYCNRVYFNWIKNGKKSRMNDIKLIEKI